MAGGLQLTPDRVPLLLHVAQVRVQLRQSGMETHIHLHLQGEQYMYVYITDHVYRYMHLHVHVNESCSLSSGKKTHQGNSYIYMET